MAGPLNTRWPRALTLPLDLIIYSILALYHTIGCLILFVPFYLIAYVILPRREAALQWLNRSFYRGFFLLMSALIPWLRFSISPRVAALRSSVIVCNHVSFLDSILLISLVRKHKTIVKGGIFKVPVFGWILRHSGFIPSTGEGRPGPETRGLIRGIKEHLDSGGNFFIFPEGTRSKDGRLGPFKKGAFSIAGKCEAPLEILQVRNTDRLLPPGQWWLNTCVGNTIVLRSLGTMRLAEGDAPASPAQMMREVRLAYLEAGCEDEGTNQGSG